LGNILFKRFATGRPTLSHWIGLILLASIAATAHLVPPLAVGAAAAAVLVIVAIWETRSFRSGAVHTIEH
jgi:low temperature requirement protein LtrA